jgi:hypothetical protein
MPHSLIFGISNWVTLSIAAVAVAAAIVLLILLGRSRLNPRLRTVASSGWVPVSLLASFTTLVLAAYGTPVNQTLIFAAYVTIGIAVPGMLWVRLLRGRASHVSEDLALGLAAGYCIEIATYLAARAGGAPVLFLLWPISTYLVFSAVPGLRIYWRGDGATRPVWWSWALAAMLGYLVIYSAGTFFYSHALTGTDTPYVDMPYHLALIAELRNHVPPEVPWVSGIPLAYHWFFYAEAAATSWATGIEPATLLYRLSGLPMFVAFVVLTATAAGRLTGRTWTGPLAVGVALFGTVAVPYAWAGIPVFDTQTVVYDTQTLGLTWISPTNLFGLAVFASVVLTLMDRLQADAGFPRRHWVLIALLVAGASGAKASLLPLLIGGLLVVVAGCAMWTHRLHRNAAIALLITIPIFALAAVGLYRGTAPGMVIGLESLRLLPVVNLAGSEGLSRLVLPLGGLVIALLLWSFQWSGAFGISNRHPTWSGDTRSLFLLGIGAAALGAVATMYYPGMSQIFYLTATAGVFGVLVSAGIARVLPERTGYRPLIVCLSLAVLVGGIAVSAIGKIGPQHAPTLAGDGLPRVLLELLLPVLLLAGLAIAAYAALRLMAPKWPVLQGAVALIVIAMVMGYSMPSVANVVAAPLRGGPPPGLTVRGAGIDAARWLRDHSDPNDLVATNLHCAWYTTVYDSCNPISFWVAGYSERRVLVEGWAYTTKSIILPSGQLAPFWDQPRLAANDSAFTVPSEAGMARLRDVYGVRWLLADLTGADANALGTYADLRYRERDYAVYELRPA